MIAALISFTPHSTFASQNWGTAEVEEFVGSISPSEDEWLDFYVTKLSGTHSPDAAETYAMKRNKVGTGMEGVCLQRPANTKDPTRGHCGASAVWVKGDHRLAMLLNLESRLAQRVLWPLVEGRYRDEHDLYGDALPPTTRPAFDLKVL